MTTMSGHLLLKEKIARKKLRMFKAYYLFYFFALGSFVPFYSIYLYDGLFLSESKVGNIMSIIPLLNIVFQPIWGVLNDKYKLDRKIVLLSMVVVLLVEVIILSIHAYSIILLLTVIYSIFNCAITPMQDSISLLFSKKYHFKYGDIRIFGSIGWALATFIAGTMIERYSFQSTIYLIMFSYSVAFVLFLKLKKVRPEKEDEGEKHYHFKSIFKNKKFILFLIFSSLSIGIFNSLNVFYNIKIKQLDGTTANIGYLTTATVFLEIITLYIATRYNHKVNHLKLLRIAILLQLPVILSYILFDNLTILYFILLVKGVYMGLQISVMMNIIQALLPKRLLTTGIIIYLSFSVGLTKSLVTFIGGYVAEYVSIESLFSILFILVICSIIISFPLEKMRKHE